MKLYRITEWLCNQSIIISVDPPTSSEFSKKTSVSKKSSNAVYPFFGIKCNLVCVVILKNSSKRLRNFIMPLLYVFFLSQHKTQNIWMARGG